MGILLLIILIVIIVIVYRHHSRKRLKNIYETENPINTQDFTFEKAVDGCCVAIMQISELDTKFKETEKTMIGHQNANGKSSNLRSWIFEKGTGREYDHNPINNL